MPRFAILHLYDTQHWWTLGSDVWRRALANGEEEGWSVFDVPGGHLPSDAEVQELDGVVLTGSARGVYENAPWMVELGAWIRRHYVADGEGPSLPRPTPLRILGGCFGHQIIAHALGGTVEPQGVSLLCAEDIQLLEAYGKEGWARGQGEGEGGEPSTSSPQVVRLIESHGDCVRLPLPPGGILLASSASCAVEMFRVGNCLGIQSHPEFNLEDVVVPILWPAAVLEGKRFAEGSPEAEASWASFSAPRHERRILADLRLFLEGR
jgi:GMP synthase-like glutamine amidotransferase